MYKTEKLKNSLKKVKVNYGTDTKSIQNYSSI